MRTIALRGKRERASPRIVSNHFNDYFHKRIIVPPSMVGVVVFKKQVLATTKLFDQFAMPCVRTPRESFLCTILILLYTVPCTSRANCARHMHHLISQSILTIKNCLCSQITAFFMRIKKVLNNFSQKWRIKEIFKIIAKRLIKHKVKWQH